jgi:hypothetical protein
MKLRVIQTHCSAINSIYIYYDFLENMEYLNLLKGKIEKYATKTEQYNSTVLLAKQTDYHTLIEDTDFNKIHESIGHTLYNTINLRNPTPNDKIEIVFEASWGICHEEGNSTKEHIHPFINFSGAFYFDVPTDTRMWFEDFQQDVKLEKNMLILFPSLCKHRVHKHVGKQPRISMAFNINCKPLD